MTAPLSRDDESWSACSASSDIWTCLGRRRDCIAIIGAASGGGKRSYDFRNARAAAVTRRSARRIIPPMHITRILPALVLGAFAFGGALAITAGAGPGLDPDSMSYLHAATTLAHGNGLRDVEREWSSADSTMPLAHWPPGYPVAIAGAERVGFGAVQGARFVGALAACVSIALVVWLVGGVAGVVAGVIAGMLMMVTPAIVQVH